MATKDFTKAEFLEKLATYGMEATRSIFEDMGYVRVYGTTSVCRFNGGKTLRKQLAYLLKERERLQAFAEERELRSRYHARQIKALEATARGDAAVYALSVLKNCSPWTWPTERLPAFPSLKALRQEEADLIAKGLPIE